MTLKDNKIDPAKVLQWLRQSDENFDAESEHERALDRFTEEALRRADAPRPTTSAVFQTPGEWFETSRDPARFWLCGPVEGLQMPLGEMHEAFKEFSPVMRKPSLGEVAAQLIDPDSRIYAAFQVTDERYQLASALVATRVPAGHSLQAVHIARGATVVGLPFVQAPTTDRASYICHAALTRIHFRGVGIAQELVTRRVITDLLSLAREKGMDLLTSSPDPFWIDAGRAMSTQREFGALVMAMAAPLDRVGFVLREVCERGARHLRRLGFELDVPKGAEPSEVLASLYHTLRTQKEIEELMNDDSRRAESQRYQRSIAMLCQRPEDGAGDGESHRDAYLLCYLASLITQAGVYTRNGETFELVQRFHRQMGGRLRSGASLIPNSRHDPAALWMGQCIVYDEHSAKTRERYHEQVRRRVEKTPRGGSVILDLDEAFTHVRVSIENLRMAA